MSTLAARLGSFQASMAERLGAEKAATIAAAYMAAFAEGLPQGAVAVGETAPDFTLPDIDAPGPGWEGQAAGDAAGRQDGERMHRLAAALAGGPVVLVFFRGLWCPFCAMTLRAMDAIRPQLEREGATLLALSPQDPRLAREAAAGFGLGLTILDDHAGTVARRYRLAWPVPASLRQLYAKFGHNLAHENGDDGRWLPMPAAYVIRPDGIVAAAKVDPRPEVRMEPAAALAAVRALRQPAAVAAG